MNKLGVFIIFGLTLAAAFAFLLTQNDDGRLAAGNGCGNCESVVPVNTETGVQPPLKPARKQPAPKETVSPEYIDFNLPDIQGAFHTLTALNDRSILVLKFGATWCPTCNAMIPELAKLEEQYQEKIRVVTIYIQEEVDHVAKHRERQNDRQLALIDKDGAVADKYKISPIPVLYVFKGKKLVAKLGGYWPYAEISKIIDQSLK